jgi:hypothetical protein
MDGPVKSPASMSSSFSSALRSLLERGTVAVSARCAQSLPSRGGEDAPGLVSGGAAETSRRQRSLQPGLPAASPTSHSSISTEPIRDATYRGVPLERVSWKRIY